jgi:hypothetical protein
VIAHGRARRVGAPAPGGDVVRLDVTVERVASFDFTKAAG